MLRNAVNREYEGDAARLAEFFGLFNTDRIDHLYQDPHVEHQRFKLHYGNLTDSTNSAARLGACRALVADNTNRREIRRAH